MQLMKIKDYAARLSAAESTIRRLCSRPEFPAYKVGKGWRIDADAADEYFRRQKTARMPSYSPRAKNWYEEIQERRRAAIREAAR